MTAPRFRALFFGSPAFAVPSLDALAALADVAGVVCQPDRPAGRGLTLTPPAVKVRAEALGLPVVQPLEAPHGRVRGLGEVARRRRRARRGVRAHLRPATSSRGRAPRLRQRSRIDPAGLPGGRADHVVGRARRGRDGSLAHAARRGQYGHRPRIRHDPDADSSGGDGGRAGRAPGAHRRRSGDRGGPRATSPARARSRPRTPRAPRARPS